MNLELYVKEIPKCEECPFNVMNITKELQGRYFCLLKSQLANGQYSAIDIIDYKKYLCPLKKLEDSLYVEINGDKIPVKVK